MKLTKEEYQELFQEGLPMFAKLCGNLNQISDDHIRLRSEDNWRREEDYKEICVALALNARKIR